MDMRNYEDRASEIRRLRRTANEDVDSDVRDAGT
jgi:hypothetical protein